MRHVLQEINVKKNFSQLCIRIQEEGEESKRFGVTLASCTGKDRDEEKPDVQGRGHGN